VDAVDRVTRSRERSELALRTELRVDPCSSSVDGRVQLDNTAEDHRLRLLFPVGRQNR
jgi:alpha-mannosidase